MAHSDMPTAADAIHDFGFERSDIDGWDLQEDDRWRWPEGYVPPPALLQDERKMNLIAQLQREIDEDDADVVELARSTCLSLDKRLIYQYLAAHGWVHTWRGKRVSERLRDSIRWRLEYGVPIRDRELLRAELATGKNIVHGFDKMQRPIVYIFPARENTWAPEQNLRCLYYTFERACQAVPPNGMDLAVIVDCKGVGLFSSPPWATVSGLIDMLGKHMPRRLGYLYFLNVNCAFYALWKLAERMLSDLTRSKICLLTSDQAEMQAVVGQRIDMDVLLSDVGGNNCYQFDVDEYLDADPFLSGHDQKNTHDMLSEHPAVNCDC